jgi:hypothetical protein
VVAVDLLKKIERLRQQALAVQRQQPSGCIEHVDAPEAGDPRL